MGYQLTDRQIAAFNRIVEYGKPVTAYHAKIALLIKTREWNALIEKRFVRLSGFEADGVTGLYSPSKPESGISNSPVMPPSATESQAAEIDRLKSELELRDKVIELKVDGFAVIQEGVQSRDQLLWRPGKVVKIIGLKGDYFEVCDGCDRKGFFRSEDLEPIEFPEVHESLNLAHRYLTRQRTGKGWRLQVIWGDLPDEVMAQEIAEMLEGYADMVAELERLRAENHELRRSKWEFSPEAHDDLIRRLGQ